MHAYSLRFSCPSAPMRMGALIRYGQKTLWCALGLAVVAHVSLSQVTSRMATTPIAKPLTTRFVKRQPRLSKPLELKRHPRPKQRELRRQTISTKGPVNRAASRVGLRPSPLIAQLARPSAEVSRAFRLQSRGLEPVSIAQDVQGARETDRRVDMSLEMVDIEALDTGLYHAMVIEDPSDKRNIRGFFHVAIAYSKSMQINFKTGTYYSDSAALYAIVDAMNEYTDIRTDVRGAYTFDAEELFQIPFILICFNGKWGGFKITAAESANLGKYLCTGGFAFLDDGTWLKGGPADRSLRSMQQDALGTRGLVFRKDWDFEKLATSHPVYHCYFDFQGPPPGHDNICTGAHYQHGAARGEAPYDYLEGIIIGGRTLAIYSMKSLGTVWHRAIRPNERQVYDGAGIRQLQFGVNLVVFALTQEGSVTKRVMDSVR